MGFDVESNDAMFQELFGSQSTTTSDEPTRNAMPRWTRGVLQAVDLVSGCDGEDVGGDLPDADEAAIRRYGEGGGGDGGAGDADGGPVRTEPGDDVRDDDVADTHLVDDAHSHDAPELERDGGDDGQPRDEPAEHVVDVSDDDVTDAPLVEAVRAPQPSSPITNAHLREPPMLSICDILGYNLRESAHVEADLTMCGLRNLGNTCWGNSLLQVLAKIQSLRIWLRQHETIAAEANETHVRPCCLCDLASDIRRLNTSVVNEPFAPRSILNRVHWNPEYRGLNQQDVNEAYLVLLDKCNRVDEDVLRSFDLENFHTARYSTPFWHIFGGLLSNRLQCLACSRSTPSLEAIYTLQLQIPPEAHPSVESALRFHSRVKDLGDEARCSVCGVPGRLTRTESVLRWPSVLSIGIQRQDLADQTISTALSFHLTLTVVDGITYDLRGVVVHVGPRVRSGHYIAYVYGRGGKWFHCEDHLKPREVPAVEVLSVEAYTLFYEKR